jgi:hypothetical protein
MKRASFTASRPLIAAVMTLALSWLVTPAAAQHLDLDASASIMGCGTATNIGHANIAPLYVDGDPCSGGGNANEPFTNIKICAPGNKTNCQVIDHVTVDTGSTGLRLPSSAFNANPSLLQAMPYVPTSDGQILTNCATFGSGLTFGPVQTADVYIADKFVKNISLQIYNQNATQTPCGFAFDAAPNGLLGVSLLEPTGAYFSCNTDGSGCQPVVSPSIVIPNPVSKFQNDNNGVTIALSQIPPSGSTEPVLGVLIFGVGTQADNTPPEGTVPLQANPSGQINLQIDGNNTVPALIDSGTSLLAISESLLPEFLPNCNFDIPAYCPSSDIDISLVLSGSNATTIEVGYTIADVDPLTEAGDIAENDAAGQPVNPAFVILGLPFFYGKTMYFVFQGQPSPLGTGPINAISPQG